MVFAAKPATPLAPASLARPEAMPAPTFERVYDECFAMVWRGLHRLGVPDALVDDATQDVFLKVHCHLHEFEGRSSVRSWVFGIAVNVAREHRRRARRGPEVVPQLPFSLWPATRRCASSTISSSRWTPIAARCWSSQTGRT